MKITFFRNREEMLAKIRQEFEPTDFEMVKRNTPYGKCIGFYDDYDDLVGVASASIYENALHIYVFEISEEYQGCGYGKAFYKLLLKHFRPDIITLDPLDDNAEAFWKKMGFIEGKNEDGDPCFINFIR